MKPRHTMRERTSRRAVVISLFALIATVYAILTVIPPHWLLKVPKYGFILYAMIGGGQVPPCMDLTIFKQTEKWLKKNDIVVSLPAKSGTHWTLYTLHMMRSRGTPEPFEDLYTETPWPEFVFYPGQPLAERIEHVQNLSARFPFSIYKSHYAPPDIPARDDVKYVVMVRNTHDAVASLRNFYQSFGLKWSKLWGGFPPNAGGNATSATEWEHFVAENGGNGEPFVVTLMQPLIGWWPYRKQKNVFIMHYSNRVKDDLKELKRLSKFLELDLTDEELSSIAKKVSYKEMKQVANTIEFRHLLDPFKLRGKIASDVFILDPSLENTMMNSGPVRQGDQENSNRLTNKIDRFLLDRFGPKVTHWIKNGGDVPIGEELPCLSLGKTTSTNV